MNFTGKIYLYEKQYILAEQNTFLFKCEILISKKKKKLKINIARKYTKPLMNTNNNLIMYLYCLLAGENILNSILNWACRGAYFCVYHVL